MDQPASWVEAMTVLEGMIADLEHEERRKAQEKADAARRAAARKR